MGKLSNLYKTVSFKTIGCIALVYCSFIFCTQTIPEEIYFETITELTPLPPPFTDMYYDVPLKFTGKPTAFGYQRTYYNQNGELYSGVQKTFFEVTNQLYSEVTFQDGLPILSKTYDLEGVLRRRAEMQYKEDFLFFKKVTGEQNYEYYYSEDHLASFKLFYKNGQVMYEGTRSYIKNSSNVLPLVGLISWYNEDGELTQRHLYDDSGELLKEIL